jgi:preprotein translocase subunit SecB
LLSCNSELKNKTKPEAGGTLVITSELGTPTTPEILKKSCKFTIILSITIVGKLKDSEDIAFSMSCGFEGSFHVIDCEKNGVPVKDNIKVWTLAASILQPLVSQFASDMALKMGLKYINVPPNIPGLYLPVQRPKKTPLLKEKNKKTKQS